MQPGMMLNTNFMVQATGMPGMPQAMIAVPMCYIEECRNIGSITCQAVICCKDYGCGKLMCEEHHSKKFIT